MTAHVRTFSPHDAVSLKIGTSLLLAGPHQSAFLPVRNFGEAASVIGGKSSHHFFGQVGKTDPHTRLSPSLLSRKGTMGEDRLTMDQKPFAKSANAIKPADLVDEAAFWAAKLTDDAAKTGKTDTALETVARQTGVNTSTLWRLRYRKPKDLAVSVYMKLKAAFEAAEKRQTERYHHEEAIARSLGVANSDVLLCTTGALVNYREELVATSKINNGAAGD